MHARVPILPVLGALILLGGGCSSGNGTSASPSASLTAVSTSAPSPSAPPTIAPGTPTVDSLPLIEWRITEPRPLEDEGVVYIEQGCWGCDGPTDSLTRVVLTGEPGALRAAERELLKPSIGEQYVYSYATSPSGNDIWASVCTRGYCGGLVSMSADAQTTVYRSLDGGIAWAEFATYDGAIEIIALSAVGPIAAQRQREREDRPTYIALLGNEAIRPPEGTSHVWHGTAPFVYWHGEGRKSILRSDGRPIFSSDRQFYVAGVPDSEHNQFLIAWQGEPPTDGATHALIRDGAKVGRYSAGPESLEVYVGTWIDDWTAIGNVAVKASDVPGLGATEQQLSLPALIDFATGELAPLELFGPMSVDAYGARRNRIFAYDDGRRAQSTTPYVVNSGGECLNLRESPSLSAPVLHCVADGVVVWAGGDQPVDAEGTTWIVVRQPDNRIGWASAEFLVR